MENTVCLTRVHVPYELSVDIWVFGSHHAVDPVRIVERLIANWAFIVELTVHSKVVTALERNSTARLDLVVADGNRHADLTRHGGAANDWLVETEFLDDGSDGANICVLIVGMATGDVIGIGKGATVGRKVEGDHGTLLPHLGVIQDAMVLTTV